MKRVVIADLQGDTADRLIGRIQQFAGALHLQANKELDGGRVDVRLEQMTIVAWADLFLGTALIVGGFLTVVLGFDAVGGVGSFLDHNAGKLHMMLPANPPLLPWTGIVFGMWIPILYYTGLNQFIVQRTLAAKSLKQGQLGVIFAGALWLVVPFATGAYYKVDYSPGTDLSRYKNIPVPTSYMVYHSDFDFMGCYDHGEEAGMMHVANHHLGPEKSSGPGATATSATPGTAS